MAMTITNTLLSIFAVALFIFPSVHSTCDAPSPAFQIPDYEHHASQLDLTSTRIYEAIKSLSQHDKNNKTSFSVEVTSETRSLFEVHHTAKIRSSVHRGADKINNVTNYRIASMTKPFTVLALLQLHKAGKLDLDAPVLNYIEDLNGPQSGSLPWKDITIRALASQMAGIPRDIAQDDLVTSPDIVAQLGLPHLTKHHGPRCDSLVNFTRACNATDLLTYVKTLEPVFAPNQKSSYSNINYDLLGLVISNVSGTTYETYITTNILHELNMEGTSFSTPPDTHAAIPADEEYYWPFEMGIQNPTGGLYSSTSDMSRFLRHVLTTYNAQSPGINWLNPTSFSGSTNSFYGMPWEIHNKQTNQIIPSLRTTRPLTLVTKGGGLPGYTSNIIILPAYGLGITILVAGNGNLMSEIREKLLQHLIPFAEHAAASELLSKYAGSYSHTSTSKSKSTNSTLTLSHTPENGLYITQWTTNNINTLRGIQSLYPHSAPSSSLILHVVPTMLFIDEKNQKGERWRVIPRTVDDGNVGDNGGRVWDNFCIADWDFFMYGGKPVNELVFWMDNDRTDEGKGVRRVERVELTGFRVALERVQDKKWEGGEGEEGGGYGREYEREHELGRGDGMWRDVDVDMLVDQISLGN